MNDLENHEALTAERTLQPRTASASHTPGPWQSMPRGQDDRKDLSHWICEENDPGHNIGICLIETRDGDDANARLIASAPDILAALQWLLGNKWKSDKDNMEFTGTISCYQMDKIREAVAKATGAAP